MGEVILKYVKVAGFGPKTRHGTEHSHSVRRGVLPRHGARQLLADLLWRRTVVSQEWLAEKLEMKSAANVSQQLRRLDWKAAIQKVPEELKHFLEEANATNS